jgi:glycosyltransferase involved in cell wall biosynthesis
MNIVTFGSTNYTCQLPRINEAFGLLGHNINNYQLPDLIYSNDSGGYDDAIRCYYETKQQFNPNVKLILNVLDIPEHLSSIESILRDLSIRLRHANRITCISKFVQSQIKKYFNVDSDVIYNPIKDVYFTGQKRDKYAMVVGRINDPNKRINLIRPINLIQHVLNIYGSENPRIGTYNGVVSDEVLNDAYNRHRIIFIVSKVEGLCLPMIEAMVCGCIPIVCRDMTTAYEFCPSELLCDPTTESINDHLNKVLDNQIDFRTLALDCGIGYSEKFSKISIANNIIEVYKKL